MRGGLKINWTHTVDLTQCAFHHHTPGICIADKTAEGNAGREG